MVAVSRSPRQLERNRARTRRISRERDTAGRLMRQQNRSYALTIIRGNGCKPKEAKLTIDSKTFQPVPENHTEEDLQRRAAATYQAVQQLPDQGGSCSKLGPVSKEVLE